MALACDAGQLHFSAESLRDHLPLWQRAVALVKWMVIQSHSLRL